MGSASSGRSPVGGRSRGEAMRPRVPGLAGLVSASPYWARWSAVLVASTLATGAVNFAFGLVVARLGGEATWSAVSPLLAAGTAGTFAGLGIEYAVTRAAMRGEPWKRVLHRVLPLGVALVIACGASVALASPVAGFLHLSESLPVPLCMTLFAASVLAAVPSGLLVGTKKIGALAGLGVASALLRVGLLWATPGSLVDRALVCSIAATIVGAVAMLIVGARAGARQGEPTDGFAKVATSGSVARAALWVTVVAPVVIARHFLPVRAAGELATVTFLASSLAYLAAPVATAFFPVMLVDKERRHLRNGLAVSLGLVVVGTAVVVPAGPAVLRLLYHTTQPNLTWLLFFGCLGVLFQTASGFLVWAALARNNATRAVYGAAVGSMPLIGLLFVFHSSPAAVLVAALPSTAALGLLSQIGSRKARRDPGRRSRRPLDLVATSPAAMGPNDVGAVTLADCSVGVMAHDEQATIQACLRSLLDARDQNGAGVHEVVVVVSGTDSTEELARAIATEDGRVRVLRQVGPAGKAAAINRFLHEAERDRLVLSSADVVLGKGMLTNLVAPLADPKVGMCGGTVVPTNSSSGLCNRLVHLTWELHDAIAAVRPKLGEIVAFRRCFDHIDERSTVDEVSMEERVASAGLLLEYVPTVLVYNHGPTRLRDFCRHRYRNHRGHLAVRRRAGYRPATLCLPFIVRRAAGVAVHRPGIVPTLLVAAAVETGVRAAARVAHVVNGAPRSGCFSRIDSAKVPLPTLPDSAIAS